MTFWTEILRFPVSSKNQCMIYTESMPTKREAENMITMLQHHIDIGAFEDDNNKDKA